MNACTSIVWGAKLQLWEYWCARVLFAIEDVEMITNRENLNRTLSIRVVLSLSLSLLVANEETTDSR